MPKYPKIDTKKTSGKNGSDTEVGLHSGKFGFCKHTFGWHCGKFGFCKHTFGWHCGKFGFCKHTSVPSHLLGFKAQHSGVFGLTIQ
jgi:hypothetical protein